MRRQMNGQRQRHPRYDRMGRDRRPGMRSPGVTQRVVRALAVALLGMLVAAAPAVGQESFFEPEAGDSGGSAEASGESEQGSESGANAGQGAGSGQGGVADGSTGEDGGAGFGAAAPSLTWNGELSFRTRALLDYDEPEDTRVSAYPELRLEGNVSGDASELIARLEYDRQVQLENPEDLIDEAYIRLFYDRLDLQAGYIKQVWGSGDKVHVVDVLNPTDYTDFINQDYLDRKRAEKMLKADIYFGTNGRLQLVYLPVFHQDRVPLEGPWVSYEARQLRTQLQNDIAGQIEQQLLNEYAADNGAVTPAERQLAAQQAEQEAALLLQQNADALSAAPEPDTLEYSQYAVRVSESFGRFDLAAQYYNGFLREPSVIDVDVANRDVEVDFDRVHHFGTDFSAAAGGFTFRGEAAYLLTEDIEGDDPQVHNNRVAYMAGFDRDLPLSNLNINIQGRGSSILANDEIEAGDPATATPPDIEYEEDESYHSNTLIASLSDSYANDTVNPELGFIYNIEDQDMLIRPELELTLKDDSSLTLRGSVFAGDDDTRFGQYDDNDYVEALFSYSF